eukprot:SAG31_NODE_4433_length_3235_cov_1.532844_5_plen_93_part_00
MFVRRGSDHKRNPNVPIERLMNGVRQLQPLEEPEARLKARFYVAYALEYVGRWAAAAEAFQDVLLELEQAGDMGDKKRHKVRPSCWKRQSAS